MTPTPTSPADDPIASIEASTVVLPIPRPLHLGPMVITERAYAVVTVRTSDGLEGHAIALSRGAPVAAAVNDLLAPALLGQSADRIEAAWDLAYRATIAAGRVGVVMRALSLVDIALWDIKGRRAGLPVWRLLGGDNPEAPCVMVAGYPTGDGPEALGHRVAQFADQGHRLLKVARVSEVDGMRSLLTTAAKEMPAAARIIVDAAWCWRGAADAADEIAQWSDAAPLAWVEDPLAPEDVDGYSRLSASGVAPIGVGDELTDKYVARSLVTRGGIDVLRIDATTIGGITVAWHLSHVAAAAGVPVSYHVYPETHIHLAAGGAARGWVETFGPADNPFDPAGLLWRGGPAFSPGTARASDAPGLGCDLDDARVAAHVAGAA